MYPPAEKRVTLFYASLSAYVRGREAFSMAPASDVVLKRGETEMPSAKILSEKQAYVADLKAKFENAVSGCVVAYGGINVENDTKLRKELREAGVEYMVVKNTMLRLAVKGTSIEGLTENFTGDTAVAFATAEDPMAAARILCKFQDGDRTKKFVVKGGFMEGKVLSAAETNAIAKLPGREGMLSMFAGALTSTLSGLAVAMQAYADKQEEPAA